MRVFVQYRLGKEEKGEVIEVSSLPLNDEGLFVRINNQVVAHLQNKLGKKSSNIDSLLFTTLKD